MTRARAALVVALTAAAYHHSLRALLADVGTDTPMAYVGLVPVLALGVALVKGRPRPGEGRLPHRQADWLIGLPLLAVAAFVATVLPGRLSYGFWTNRVDLLGLPFFVAGLVALLLGSRVLYRVRLPVAALALAWPLPYQLAAERVLAAANAVTLAGVGWAAPLLGVGTPGRGTTFAVGSGAGRFVVNVAPACAGANTVVGFLLVGGAVACVAGGSRPRTAAWLAFGVAAQLALNVARILAVFAVGAAYGERAAIDWLHPYMGTVLFLASVALLVAWLPRFGVPVRLPAAVPAAGPVTAGPRPPQRAGAVTAAACALALAAPNAALARFDPYLGLGDAGAYRPVSTGVPAVGGWAGRHAATVTWARPYFGTGSAWERLAYTRVAGHRRALYVDAVRTTDLRAFTRYGLQACYRFHDYDVVAAPRAAVGAPDPAQTLSYTDAQRRSWSVVSWVWAVGAGRFERVVVLGRHDGTAAGRAQARAELVAFARSLVRAQRGGPA